MKPGKFGPRRVLGLFALIVGVTGAFVALRAAEDQESLGAGLIYDRFWLANAFPLTWKFHSDGVINNDAVGAGTAAVANADARAELEQAFAAWQNVGTASVSFSYGGETANGLTGCDGENIITWSDTADFASPTTTIARGITTRYTGVALTLDATNRGNVVCSDGGTVMLPEARYPDGTVLPSGAILDMDMSFNSTDFDYVTTPNAVNKVADIEAIAVHEFGHMLGLAHASLAYSTTADRATMYPAVSTASISSQDNVKTLELDDLVSVGRRYPATGFWPTGGAPYNAGAIRGRLLQSDGKAAEGIRVWAYRVNQTAYPVVEAFSATGVDWDPAVSAGDYILPGLPPGKYYVCIVPWNNGVGSDDPAGNTFNRTATAYNTDAFDSECYDDKISTTAAPEFRDPIPVEVVAGQTTPKINLTTGVQKADIVLVMDRSGSMNLASGTPGVTKNEALRAAAQEFVDFLQLDDNHRLGLVQFEENVVPLAPVYNLQTLTSATVGDALAAIGAITAGGLTNIIAGIDAALTQLAGEPSPNPRQVVVLFSDGKHNRPVGSDLSDSIDVVVDNDVKFYSIGFGTDVDDAILSEMATATGGLHVNEQDLDPLGLQKLFVGIAASAVDAAVLIDPRYDLAPGAQAQLPVHVSSDETYLTFAVHYPHGTKKPPVVRILAPGGKCEIPQSDGNGVRRIVKPTYQLVRVRLPYGCSPRKQDGHNGAWKLIVENASAEKPITADLIVFGKSRTNIITDVVKGRKLTAKILRDGVPVSRAKLRAEILPPLPATGDSASQDQQKKSEPGLITKNRKDRWRKIEMRDGGKGIFEAALPAKTPGLYRVRIVAEYTVGRQPMQMEKIASVYVK